MLSPGPSSRVTISNTKSFHFWAQRDASCALRKSQMQAQINQEAYQLPK